MKKEIYINESMGETRIAILEDGQLVEVYIEKQDKHRMVGNVYRGVVENVLPGMQAAFVDIGYDINAFLPFTESKIINTLMKRIPMDILKKITAIMVQLK